MGGKMRSGILAVNTVPDNPVFAMRQPAFINDSPPPQSNSRAAAPRSSGADTLVHEMAMADHDRLTGQRQARKSSQENRGFGQVLKRCELAVHGRT